MTLRTNMPPPIHAPLREEESVKPLSSSRTLPSSLLNAGFHHLSELIADSNWETLRMFLSSEEGMSVATTHGLVTNRTGQAALHLACQCNPPLDIVELLTNACSSAITLQDASGRTPLHAATATWASWDVIKFLLLTYSQAAAMVDYKLKTPLILLCENYPIEETPADDAANRPGADAADAPAKRNRPYPVLKVVKALCQVAPLAVLTEDEEDMSALEHAICRDADLKVVKFLMDAAKEAGQRKDSVKKKKKAESEASSSRPRVLTRVPSTRAVQSKPRPQSASAKMA